MKETIKNATKAGVFNPIVESILNVTLWFIMIGVSYLIQLLGWAEIPEVFFCIEIAFTILSLIIVLFGKVPIKAKILGSLTGLFYEAFLVLVAYIVSIIFTNFNFFEVYMLISLGKCFKTPKKK